MVASVVAENPLACESGNTWDTPPGVEMKQCTFPRRAGAGS